MYFSSPRPGGLGVVDIYAARHLGPNSGGPAVNVGPLVNTAGADMGPSLGPDGKTCRGFGARPDGLAASDIYYTRQANIDRVVEKT